MSTTKAPLTIVIANKRYSSWSMRPWLALRVAAGKDGFEEILCNLNQKQATALQNTSGTQTIHPFSEVSKYSPTRKVPVLIDRRFASSEQDEFHVWESIAILIHIAETFPDANLFPRDIADKALCLSIVSEMHAGFMALRQNLGVHTVGRGRRHGEEALQKPEVRSDIRRIGEMWSNLRSRALAKDPQAGPFLFGHFTIADAMYAPVSFRFTVYDDETLSSLDEYPLAKQYVRDIQATEAVQEWVEAAKTEPVETFLDYYEKLMD